MSFGDTLKHLSKLNLFLISEPIANILLQRYLVSMVIVLCNRRIIQMILSWGGTSMNRLDKPNFQFKSKIPCETLQSLPSNPLGPMQYDMSVAYLMDASTGRISH